MQDYRKHLEWVASLYVHNTGDNCDIYVYISDPEESFGQVPAIPAIYSEFDSDIFSYLQDVIKREKAKNFTLCFCVPAGSKFEPKQVDHLKKRVHGYFLLRRERSLLELKEDVKGSLLLVLYGFLFMLFCMLVRELFNGYPEDSFFNSIREGLLVLGWVALWGPFEKLLFDWLPIRKECRLWGKLAKMKIKVIEKDFPKTNY